MSDSGFVDVYTKPATHSISIPDLGTFARGSGPVVGADGTVFLGSMEGRLVALHADGSAYWNRGFPSGHSILTAPAVGSDGSVYVVTSNVTRDQRGGASTTIYHATLTKFTVGGGVPLGNSTPFPENRTLPDRYGPRLTGPPRLWRFGNDEAVIVPAVYPTVGGSDLHLVAFAPGGGIMADVTVAYWGGEDVTGGPVIPPGFTHGQIQSAPRYARAAIAPHPQGGTPFIVIPNRYHREIVGYTFCVGPSCSPHPGFIERFRTDHAPHALLSSPTVVPTGADNRLKFAVGTDKGVVFSGPAPGTASNLVITGTGFGNWIYAAPTVTRNGRVILALGGQPVTLIRDHVAGPGVPIAGGTFVQAASSRTHLFAATTDAFYTLDAEGQTLLANYDWYDGGVNPPAIGPGGYVYGMAANILFVFPPPSGLIGRPDREVIGDPAGPA